MRLLLAAILILAAPAAVAEADRRPTTYRPVPQDARSLTDCPRPLLQHAARGGSTRVAPLAAMPDAYRLYTVDRRVDGCAVYPEAQKVSDRTGRLAVPEPRRR